MQTYWPNPWSDAVPVPLSELVTCLSGAGHSYGNLAERSDHIGRILQMWARQGDKLDAYIIPRPSGWHDIGVRYGAEEHEYLSPLGNKDRVSKLLAKYR